VGVSKGVEPPPPVAEDVDVVLPPLLAVLDDVDAPEPAGPVGVAGSSSPQATTIEMEVARTRGSAVRFGMAVYRCGV
jgi:hypothetical protein